MSDVQPPYRGVCGADACREVWPHFFECRAQGALGIEEAATAVGG
ncbi:hypothetical protein [Streptomyces sp. B27]|nr:hypothetical protein [Streptomyces sp. B27]